MNILTFFAGREDNCDLFLYPHKPVFEHGTWQNAPNHKYDGEIYIGNVGVLPEVTVLPHKSKRVTMFLGVGREDELTLEVLRKVAENYGGLTIDNVIQNYEQIIKERKENDKKKYL